MSPALRRATVADLVEAETQGRRLELLGGTLVEKEAAGNRHGASHGGVFATVRAPFRGRGGPQGPGGWVFLIEPSVLAGSGDVVVPDVAGWRRERAPSGDEFPLTVAPDWVCEVVYSSHGRDVGQKPPIYLAMNVGHYWVVDLNAMVLTVYRAGPDGWVWVAGVGPEGKVRLEPFDAVELPAADLFGLDEAP